MILVPAGLLKVYKTTKKFSYQWLVSSGWWCGAHVIAVGLFFLSMRCLPLHGYLKQLLHQCTVSLLGDHKGTTKARGTGREGRNGTRTFFPIVIPEAVQDLP
jgi:hypothetical protein